MASSRPYKVTVRESLQGVIAAEDHVETKIELPPIGTAEDNAASMRRVLGERGFVADGGNMVRERSGVRVAVDPNTGGVRVTAEVKAEVNLEEGGNLPGCPPCAIRAEEQLRQTLRDRLDREVVRRTGILQEDVTALLEREIGAIGCELERVANQVTSEAVIRRAREMGEIKKISRSEDGSMTVVVEVA